MSLECIEVWYVLVKFRSLFFPPSLVELILFMRSTRAMAKPQLYHMIIQLGQMGVCMPMPISRGGGGYVFIPRAM